MFKYALFPSLISSPLPPIYSFHLIFSPCCVISALYITTAHFSNRLFVIYLFVTSPSFLFPASLPPLSVAIPLLCSSHSLFLSPSSLFLHQYFSSYTSLPYIIFLLFFSKFLSYILIIFSYLDGIETISLPYFVERVVSVLLSVHCITTSAPFV